MDCYRVHIPMGARIDGATANGEPTCVLSGDYLVHRLFPKLPTQRAPVLRFVGADPAGRDVHVALGHPIVDDLFHGLAGETAEETPLGTSAVPSSPPGRQTPRRRPGSATPSPRRRLALEVADGEQGD